MEFKGGDKTDDAGIWHANELQVKIDNPDATAQILESIGLRKLRPFIQHRENWSFGKINICFQDRPQCPLILEIEGESSTEVNELLMQLKDFVKHITQEEIEGYINANAGLE